MHFQSDDGIVYTEIQLSLEILVFVQLLSKFKDTMYLLSLSFILYVLKLSSGSGFCSNCCSIGYMQMRVTEFAVSRKKMNIF